MYLKNNHKTTQFWPLTNAERHDAGDIVEHDKHDHEK